MAINKLEQIYCINRTFPPPPPPPPHTKKKNKQKKKINKKKTLFKNNKKKKYKKKKNYFFKIFFFFFLGKNIIIFIFFFNFFLFLFFFFFVIYTFIHCSLSFHSSPLGDTLGLPLMKWDLSVGALSKWSKNKKPIDSHNHIRYPVHRPVLFAWIPTIHFLLGGGDTLVYITT